jgi:hypothetical protein
MVLISMGEMWNPYKRERPVRVEELKQKKEEKSKCAHVKIFLFHSGVLNPTLPRSMWRRRSL